MNSPPGNPDFDAGALFDAHMAAEFTAPDLDATMATMTDAPVLTHVPVLTGGYGYDAVRGFYAKYFLKHWPAGHPGYPHIPHHRERSPDRRDYRELHPRHRDAGDASRR